MTPIRSLAFCSATCLFLVAPSLALATIYDDFETDAGDTSPDNNGIEGSLWPTINDNWHRNNFGGNQARSQATGESATGSLISAGISVPSGEWLTLEGNGFRGGGSNTTPLLYASSIINVINVRQNTSGGTIIAQIVPDDDGRWTYHVDPRGSTTLFVEAIDASTAGGFGWIGIDTVQTASNTAGVLISNGSLENGLTGWTTSGTAFNDAVRQSNGASRGPYEGGVAGVSLGDNGSESATGTLRSPAITVTYDTLSFATVGFTGGGTNFYRLLDSTFSPIAGSTVAPPHSDNWSVTSLNLLSLGLTGGQTFYLETVDNNTSGSFGWLGVDYVRLTGNPVAVPEPGSGTLLSLGSLLMMFLVRKSRQHR